MRWFVVTLPLKGKEYIERRLREMKKSFHLLKGSMVLWVPMITERVIRSGEVVEEKYPAFPRYGFVGVKEGIDEIKVFQELEDWRAHIGILKKTAGKKKTMRKVYAQVPEKEIKVIRRLEARRPKLEREVFSIGDLVFIRSGPIKGFAGVIVINRKRKRTVFVDLNYADCHMRFEVDYDDIEKISYDGLEGVTREIESKRGRDFRKTILPKG